MKMSAKHHEKVCHVVRKDSNFTALEKEWAQGKKKLDHIRHSIKKMNNSRKNPPYMLLYKLGATPAANIYLILPLNTGQGNIYLIISRDAG